MMVLRPYKRFWAVLAALLLLFAISLSRADDGDPFVVRSAEFTLDQSLMLLDLAIDSDIPDYISIAIEQGFSVPIMFEVEIRARKRYWFDDRVVSLKQQYLLHHQPMLDSYVVFDVNNSERRYFDDRHEALRFIEVVYNYPLLDINNLAHDREFYARVRFGIDTDELPQPLKSSSLWDNDWDLKSDWYEWEVERPES
ncbi:MAG: DUF4390 domain-containing protein [Gammaproteobacteria bacterium]|nr:DUF4390 domain-containing protein [Gammaproteobacteria bacterium]